MNGKKYWKNIQKMSKIRNRKLLVSEVLILPSV